MVLFDVGVPSTTDVLKESHRQLRAEETLSGHMELTRPTKLQLGGDLAAQSLIQETGLRLYLRAILGISWLRH